MSFKLLSLALLAVPALAQSPVWGQCGGIGWTGATTCAAGTSCVIVNSYYSQCQPGGSPSSSSSSTAVSTPSQPSSTSTGGIPAPTGACATVPSNPTLTANTRLPDPFKLYSGARITTKAQWTCRRSEIFSLFQSLELGTLPGKPSSVTASLSGRSLAITASEAGKSISFTVTITPASGGSAPYPAIIAYGGLSIPQPAGVAVITFNNDDIAAQVSSGSRGQGKFYTLYGNTHTASAMTAWAWGVARIIDALEITPAANINPQRVAVTGCSRNGKGALVAGAFEPRVALTIPQESGSGGAACWRLSDAMKAAGKNVQTASQIITENVWFSKSFEANVNQVSRLPFDHHMLAGLVAPRGLYVIENSSMEWLGNESTFGCMKAGQKIYQALGVTDSMGFSSVGGHNHCAFPSSQQAELTAFVNRFLLGQSANTAVMKTDGGITFNEGTWIDWTVPNLS